MENSGEESLKELKVSRKESPKGLQKKSQQISLKEFLKESLKESWAESLNEFREEQDNSKIRIIFVANITQYI